MTTRRSLVSSDCTTTFASSHPAEVRAVNIRAFPPGRACGNWSCSPLETSGVVTSLVVPPVEDTLEIPPPWRLKKMVPSSPQLAPHKPVPPNPIASQIVTGGPPTAGTFLILLSAQNPIQPPSGEK